MDIGSVSKEFQDAVQVVQERKDAFDKAAAIAAGAEKAHSEAVEKAREIHARFQSFINSVIPPAGRKVDH